MIFNPLDCYILIWLPISLLLRAIAHCSTAIPLTIQALESPMYRLLQHLATASLNAFFGDLLMALPT